MTTIRELIKSALRAIGAIDPRKTPTELEMSNAMEALNLMLESWYTDTLFVYVLTEGSFTLTADDPEYTIGVGGNYNTVRPFDILGAFCRVSSIDYPLDIIGEDEYNAFAAKTSSGIPARLNYLPESPLGKIRLYPAPLSAYALHLQMKTPLAEITDLDQTITFEPGYKAAIKWNLAIDLAPEWDAEPSQVVVARAAKTLDDISTQNMARRGIEPARLDLFGKSGAGSGTYMAF